MKGQAQLIEHTFTIILGVVLMSIIASLMYVFYVNSIKSEITEGLRQVAIETSENIMKLYSISRQTEYQPYNQTGDLIVEIDLSLPSEVAKRNYEVFLAENITNFTSFFQNSVSVNETYGVVVAQTTQDPVIRVEQSIPNMEMIIGGKISNGNDAKLKFYRYNINGTLKDYVILGDMDIGQLVSS